MAEPVIHLDVELQRRIADLARSTGVSPAEYVRTAVEELAARRNGGPQLADSSDLLKSIARITEGLPDEELDKLPSDLAKNFDHYHYGHPRED
ncbi:MAG: hypothetical protein H6816_06005 [Phycisphaerales bacterium]|nr:hypothetical protein [Phycisphaerales bacterium]